MMTPVPYTQLRSTRKKQEDKDKDQQRINDYIRQNFLALRTIPDRQWNIPVLTAGWSQHPTLPFRYRRDSQGYVHFRGQVQYFAGLSNPFAILPVGYRPVVSGYFPATSTPFGLRQVGVDPTGNVNGNALVANDFLILDGISYLAEF